MLCPQVPLSVTAGYEWRLQIDDQRLRELLTLDHFDSGRMGFSVTTQEDQVVVSQHRDLRRPHLAVRHPRVIGFQEF
jgi:hypothetical protein